MFRLVMGRFYLPVSSQKSTCAVCVVFKDERLSFGDGNIAHCLSLDGYIKIFSLYALCLLTLSRLTCVYMRFKTTLIVRTSQRISSSSLQRSII